MKPHLLFILLIALLRLSSVRSNTYFITPRRTCGKSCAGTSTQPFDNLLIAINSLQSSSTQNTLLLLNDPITPHHILQKELAPPGNTFLWEFPDYTQFQVKNLIIKPLFCNEEPAKSDASFQTMCLKPGQKLPVFVKSTKFTLSILENLEIRGLTFNAIEDISIWNQASKDLSDCLYNRKQCCRNGERTSWPHPSTVLCQSHGNYSSILGSSSMSGGPSLLSLESGSLLLQSVDFVNFMSPNVTSRVQTRDSKFSLTLAQINMDSLYFGKGVIYHRGDSLTANSSSISLNLVRFTNYNAWDLQRIQQPQQDSGPSEGYLFLSEGKFSGEFIINNQ